MEKRSFILYCDFKEQLDLLDYEEKGRLIEAIFDHECGEPIKDLPPMVKMAFASIRPHLVRNAKEWEDLKRKRAEAGRRGGLAKAINAKQSQAEDSNTKHNVNVNANDNDNVNDNYNDNVNDYYYKGTDVVVDDFTLIKMFVDNFGRQPSKFEVDRTMWMFTAYDRELVEDAFEVASQQDKKNIAYVMGILNKQKEAGISNMEDLAQYNMKKGRV